MNRFALGSAILAAFIAALLYTLQPTYITNFISSSITTTTTDSQTSMTAARAMSTLRHASIKPHRSATRGHADHGWLNTYHSFSFANWYHPDYQQFGSLRVLNEDRVAPNSGFPTHPHRNAEIFSYILSGELTHRDSMIKKGQEAGVDKDAFYRMRRGDVQFTTGGTGIAHSEFNENHKEPVHFLQIWALPWKNGLAPRYSTQHFDDERKRAGFVSILSPLVGGPDATPEQHKNPKPTLEGTIPINADFTMGAGLIAPEAKFTWVVGGKATEATKRKVFVHLPMTKNGKAKIRLDGREDAELSEGDGAFIEGVAQGDKLVVESIGSAEAEVIVLDSAN
ncbi:pirin domain-containing protein [Emericellopsis atlantica]|uniref:Pirin domain-containing protein n=1 Tax=Emericellopsis atlantica TaxID=2614577 RepID=A0A9P7ZUH8_9HYPO|nr:pirin domain-containing protein [Emericellopsis atlantica]KAG9258579.1 pirin domain-containing protein [Emericellopsis atlantica]